MFIETVDTNSNISKLTIAKNRVTLKYQKDLWNVDKQRLYKISLKIVDILHKPDMITRRGQFELINGQYVITMYIQTSKDNKVDGKSFYMDISAEWRGNQEPDGVTI